MPKPCETAARKLLGERMRKSEAPAGFKNKPLLSALPLSEGSADLAVKKVCLKFEKKDLNIPFLLLKSTFTDFIRWMFVVGSFRIRKHSMRC